MASRKQATPAPVVPSAAENVGITLREVLDAEPGVIRGYRAASEPELVEARKAANVERRSALTAQLLADLG